jgi:Ser/Thr protein kinase RdoA (MazF antagonist)
MSSNRINDFMFIDKKEVLSLFAQFDSTLKILEFSPIDDSMSNSGYVVTTDSNKYLLKVYSNTTDKIEVASYLFLKDKINIPKLYYYDGSKEHFPFAYTISEFLEGVTFIKYVRNDINYPQGMAYEIGRMCAKIHKNKYEYDALLDENLSTLRKLPSTRKKILHLSYGNPAKHLKAETINQLRRFIDNNPDVFDKIEAESVLCHGDFGYNNIMVSKSKVYCIDFEFAYSGSIYNDIGHFFRRKDDDVQNLIDGHIYDSFAQGYNSISTYQLPPDWLKLAHLCDINAMLCLLSYDSVPVEWINDIEHDILCAINSDN